VPRALRIAQVAEGIFALLSLILALSLPWPPRGNEALAAANLIAFALVSLWLAYRLARPSRAVVITAAVLSTIVVLRGVLMIGISALAADRTVMWKFWLLVAVYSSIQLVVGVCLWVARGVLPRRDTAGSAEAV
jgi:hypothetical protein